ncbi:hypothetical protein AMATHDRAFT_66371 [Amanita thiersii Skay4041]|uniref:Carboxylic ester hydrolase n=1 Tax=Amanita thiersii Skay4041 TaxID=703135 RepID=A0A2A9NAH6_9AGAR|nr:hypothetical protein AMATHDRAFT_66371 [Amanita thiersii Skay4041]
MRSKPVLSLALSACFAAAAAFPGPPISVRLDGAIFTGTSNGPVNKFLGIPYAQAPVGDLRFRPPMAIPAYTGIHDASRFGPACPQQEREVPDIPKAAQEVKDYLNFTLWQHTQPSSEDCLTINVITPKSIVPGLRKLPVVVWFHGGGFEMSSASTYDGTPIVRRSIDLNEPVVYVSMNYRLSALGFLGGDVVRAAGLGNLGLHDQRLALRWVQKYISSFGGDPDRVTIWGQSAGAMSVAMQMITNDGDTEGLFHAAFMQSGSPIPFGWIDGKHGQRYWDAMMVDTGCGGQEDEIECLRQMPFDELMTAINKSPDIFDWESIIEAWIPRADGVFLKDTPQRLVGAGSVADVPFIIGNVDDEGTLFTFANLNITTQELLGQYAHSNFFPDITDEELQTLLGTHAEDPAAGSPFGTGLENALTPEFKRESAAKGDMVFQAPRRYFLNQVADKRTCWMYLNKRNKLIPYLGSYQGSDLPQFYTSGEMQDYLIFFTNTHDPNRERAPSAWPQYDLASRSVLTLYDFVPTDGNGKKINITSDTFRADTFEYITMLAMKYPL